MIYSTGLRKSLFLDFVTTLLLTEKTRSTILEEAGIAKYRLAKTLKIGNLIKLTF
jgi:hypothetical protein